MFEKHKSTRPESTRPQSPNDGFSATEKSPANSGRAAVIGPGIHINGDVSGNENLIIEGRVDGKIKLDSHQVEIGQSGRVHADISAKVIKIAGEVRGDMKGSEKVIISRTGNVNGNIVAPRMTLEDGAIFKGSIDMDPGEPEAPKVAKPAKKVSEKPVGVKPEPAKIISSDKSKEATAKGSAYSLNGG